MLEYLPWSTTVKNEAIDLLRQGVFSSLDIEMGGDCPYSCVYCETPYRDKVSLVNYSKIEEFIRGNKIKWIYICGIGEPTYNRNSSLLSNLLNMCSRNNVRCSIFTNLSNLTDEFIDYIRNGVLYTIIKFDSQNPDIIQAMYNPDNITNHLRAVDKILSLVHAEDGKTNIAASIVPTQANVDELPSLVKYCVDHSVYPLIGQLEYSGSAKDVFTKYALDDDMLLEQKTRVEEILGEQYHIPFCPAVIAGYHIKLDNSITIDRRSGLSCHWFWLDEPDVEKIADLDDHIIFEDIGQWILSARKMKIEEVIRSYRIAKSVFGGCGGNVVDIMDIYLRLMKERDLYA